MTIKNNSGEIIIYEGADGAHGIEVRVERETVNKNYEYPGSK